VLALFNAFGVFCMPTQAVADCRDADGQHTPGTRAGCRAGTIVSGDGDLLVLHPWRGVRREWKKLVSGAR